MRLRLLISHTGFVRGIPPRHRAVGEMPTIIETAVEVAEVRADDAPVVYRVGTSSPLDIRCWDSRFYSQVYPEFQGMALAGHPISIERLEAKANHKPYTKRFPWRHYVSRLPGRTSWNEPRRLEDWRAKEVDASDLSVFESAIREVMSNYIWVEGRLWTRCFEPCLEVVWYHQTARSQKGAYMRVGDVANLHGYVDADDFAPDGLRRIQPTASQIRSATVTHSRCFSALEPDRARSYLREVGGSDDPAIGAHWDGIEAIEPSLASRDFDRLELGRSARLAAASKDLLYAVLRQDRTQAGCRKLMEGVDLALTSRRLVEATRAFEEDHGSPEDVVEAIEDVRREMTLVLGRITNVDRRSVIADIVPPPYYGNLDAIGISIPLAAPAVPR